MKTKWLFSVTICLATFQLGATSPLAAREKDLLPKDVSVDEQLPNEGLKIEQILKEDSKIEIQITRGPAVVFADNQNTKITLSVGDIIKIEKSNKFSRVIRVE